MAVTNGEEPMQKWYVVACRPGQEPRAVRNLRQSAFTVYCPTLFVEVEKRNKTTTVEEPLFPDYIFVRFDPVLNATSLINNSRGVKKIVAFGNILASISDGVIESIMTQLGQKPTINEKLNLIQGQKVKVSLGVFAGIEAVFKEPDGDKRSVMLINILGRQTEVTIENKLI